MLAKRDLSGPVTELFRSFDLVFCHKGETSWHRNPTPALRTEVVRVALTSGLPRKQIAADFGVGFLTLSRWIQQDRCNPEKSCARTDLEREVAELRKENRMLLEEREEKKEATQVFAERSE